MTLIDTLSPREREVAHLAHLGLTNKEIAAQLGLHESTIDTNMQRVFAKTGVRNRVELTRLVLGLSIDRMEAP